MLLIRDVDSILTLDARRRILERHSVLIDEGKILRIGNTATLDRDHLDAARNTGRIIEGPGCMMLPACVNTHVHTVEHLSRGLIPDDLATWSPTRRCHGSRTAATRSRTARAQRCVWPRGPPRSARFLKCSMPV